MEVVQDYELVDKIKARLKSAEEIIFSTHTFEELIIRPVSETELKDALWNPKNLMHAESQKDDIEKYRLFFRRARNYDLVIVIKFINSKIKIITARIQYKKRVRLREKWRKRLQNKR